MKIIYLPRGKGKTTKLVEWFLEDMENRIVLVGFPATRKMFLEKVRKHPNFPKGHNLPEWHIQTYDSPQTTQSLFAYGAKIKIAIDEAEAFIQSKFHYPVSIISVTEKEEDDRE